jgi:hypothetical protein
MYGISIVLIVINLYLYQHLYKKKCCGWERCSITRSSIKCLSLATFIPMLNVAVLTTVVINFFIGVSVGMSYRTDIKLINWFLK